MNRTAGLRQKRLKNFLFLINYQVYSAQGILDLMLKCNLKRFKKVVGIF